MAALSANFVRRYRLGTAAFSDRRGVRPRASALLACGYAVSVAMDSEVRSPERRNPGDVTLRSGISPGSSDVTLQEGRACQVPSPSSHISR
jgi:hypothetical protein